MNWVMSLGIRSSVAKVAAMENAYRRPRVEYARPGERSARLEYVCSSGSDRLTHRSKRSQMRADPPSPAGVRNHRQA